MTGEPRPAPFVGVTLPAPRCGRPPAGAKPGRMTGEPRPAPFVGVTLPTPGVAGLLPARSRDA